MNHCLTHIEKWLAFGALCQPAAHRGILYRASSLSYFDAEMLRLGLFSGKEQFLDCAVEDCC